MSRPFDLSDYEAVLCDLDGVLTDTAPLHAEAWKSMFDEFLARWSADHSRPFNAFQIDPDYLSYVDGKPRFEGVASFLESRRIVLPEGTPDDSADADTIHGLSNRKNQFFQRLVAERGVDPFAGSVQLIEHARDRGLRTAVVSSSRNAPQVLTAAKLDHLFDVVVDANVAEAAGLTGKPAPDTLVEAARRLDVSPGRCVAVEDAIVGVEAGRLAGVGFVIGVDRDGQAARLERHGADIVVEDLADLVSGGDD